MFVIPAKTGIYSYAMKLHCAVKWIPAFAGMTV